MTRLRGSESVACVVAPPSPWPPPLAPPYSAVDRSALFASFAATTARSDFSSPCIIGFGFSPSRCGPPVGTRADGQTGDLPSRAKSIHTCQGLRPRRADRALAMTRPVVLPSAFRTASAPEIRPLSRLDGWPMCTPVNASSRTSRCATHDSGPMWFATPSSQWTFTTYSLPVSPAHRQSGWEVRDNQDGDLGSRRRD